MESRRKKQAGFKMIWSLSHRWNPKHLKNSYKYLCNFRHGNERYFERDQMDRDKRRYKAMKDHKNAIQDYKKAT